MLPANINVSLIDMRLVNHGTLRLWLRLSSQIMRDYGQAVEQRAEHAHQVLRLHFALDFDHWTLQEMQDGEYATRLLFDVGHDLGDFPLAHMELSRRIDVHQPNKAAQGQHYMRLPAIFGMALEYLTVRAHHQHQTGQVPRGGRREPPQAEPLREGATQNGPPTQPQPSSPLAAIYQQPSSQGSRQSIPRYSGEGLFAASSQRRSRSPRRESSRAREDRTQIQYGSTGVHAIPTARLPGSVSTGGHSLQPPTAPILPAAAPPLTFIFPNVRRWCALCNDDTFIKVLQVQGPPGELHFCRNCNYLHGKGVINNRSAQNVGGQLQGQQGRASDAIADGTGASGQAVGGPVDDGLVSSSLQGGRQGGPSVEALGKQAITRYREDWSLHAGAANVRSRDVPTAPVASYPAPGTHQQNSEVMARDAEGTVLPDAGHAQDQAKKDGAEHAGDEEGKADVGDSDARATAKGGNREDNGLPLGHQTSGEDVEVL